MRAAAERCGRAARARGAQQAHEPGASSRRTQRDRGARAAPSRRTRRPLEPDLDRHPARPSSCRRRWARSIPSASIDADDRAGEAARRRRAPAAGLTEPPKPGRSRAWTRVAAAERGGGVEERGLGGAEAVQQQHVRPLAHRQRARSWRARPGTCVDRAAGAGGRPGARNRPSKPDREVEVAAGVEAALRERLDARELALAQLQPGASRRCRSRRRARAGWRRRTRGADAWCSGPPSAADVAQPDVVGGVEARLRPRGTARGGVSRAERPIEGPRCRRQRTGHRTDRYPAARSSIRSRAA